MSYRTDIVYRYDGSFEGMMCAVFDAFYRREQPSEICGPDAGQVSIFEVHEVETDADKPERVLGAAAAKISPEAAGMVRDAYLTCLEGKELIILNFLRLGFRVGAGVVNMLADDSVNALSRAVKAMYGEAHLLKGFIRFAECDGVLVSTIEPKNHALPIIAEHFADRYRGEAFMIYDETHSMALMHRRGERDTLLIELESFEMPELSGSEIIFRALWRRFYNTIGIEGRYNPRCRMSHMPKRYWKHMTEFQDDGAAAARLDDRNKLGSRELPN